MSGDTTERYGNSRCGGTVTPIDLLRPSEGEFWWCAWRGTERMTGIAADRTNAFCALLHFLDPDEAA